MRGLEQSVLDVSRLCKTTIESISIFYLTHF